MTDTIEVIISVDDARRHLDANNTWSRSKYLKPGLESLERKGRPYGTRLTEKNFAKDMPVGSIIQYCERDGGYKNSSLYRKIGPNQWVYDESNAISRDSTFAPNYHIVVYEPDWKSEATELVFEMPVEEARRIGGCLLTPLVDKWDRENKKWKVGDCVEGVPNYATLPAGTLLGLSNTKDEIQLVVLDNGIVFNCNYPENKGKISDYYNPRYIKQLPQDY